MEERNNDVAAEDVDSPKIEIYSSAFNLIKNKFNYLRSIDNFCNFADYVTIAVNTSQDNTFTILQILTEKYPNLSIVSCDIPYTDPLLDGKIKNFALQSTKIQKGEAKGYLMSLDLDEIIDLNIKEWFVKNAEMYLSHYNFDALLVPSVNLWGSIHNVRWDADKNKAYKWYIHKAGFSRGAVRGGVINGFLDINKSDGTELIKEDGSLTNYFPVSRGSEDNGWSKPPSDYYADLVKNQIPYVFHLGYLDLQERIERNKAFWSEQWKACSNDRTVDVCEDIEKLQAHETYPHGLNVDFLAEKSNTSN